MLGWAGLEEDSNVFLFESTREKRKLKKGYCYHSIETCFVLNHALLIMNLKYFCYQSLNCSENYFTRMKYIKIFRKKEKQVIGLSFQGSAKLQH